MNEFQELARKFAAGPAPAKKYICVVKWSNVHAQGKPYTQGIIWKSEFARNKIIRNFSEKLGCEGRIIETRELLPQNFSPDPVSQANIARWIKELDRYPALLA